MLLYDIIGRQYRRSQRGLKAECVVSKSVCYLLSVLVHNM